MAQKQAFAAQPAATAAQEFLERPRLELKGNALAGAKGFAEGELTVFTHQVKGGKGALRFLAVLDTRPGEPVFEEWKYMLGREEAHPGRFKAYLGTTQGMKGARDVFLSARCVREYELNRDGLLELSLDKRSGMDGDAIVFSGDGKSALFSEHRVLVEDFLFRGAASLSIRAEPGAGELLKESKPLR
jgi:hypothetical protein